MISQELVNHNGVEAKIRLHCSESGAPYLVCMEVKNQIEGAIPDEIRDFLHISITHLQNVLTLVSEKKYRRLPFIFWRFSDPKDDSPFEIRIDAETKPKEIDYELSNSIFFYGMKLREPLHIMSEFIDEDIPIHFRFLAFYRLLEYHFRPNGSWNRKKLRDQIALCFDEYKGSMGIDELITEIHTLRDSCAHIRTGSGTRAKLGTTSLNRKQIDRLQLLMPIAREVVRTIINELADGDFGFNDIRPWHQRLEPANAGSAEERNGANN